ncbi:molybdate-anion transporter precursor [Xenopus laevis]|uniref:Solute carrier family 61 member 1 n=1 Tax=Xenopus laevis TaxID=8355 RepID=MFSD5_XENLA|nr:molybdate-anion transporter precursor [Xenopus laevis]Q08B29.1 RecName: Full=Molybdate-anion transporter; AltName: Full=Major facilitator superfamily domain-containing protein 5; AltName: Full=Molybdate transporter 2 homolog [Xenopus laevis]AAI24900.1 Mfsd5 protein [Xenopus laevis]
MLVTAYLFLLGLLALWGVLEFSACHSKPSASSNALGNPAFRQFQYDFYRTYFPALAADWLQGPYLYKLYQHYHFLEGQIAIIYVCGFGASVFAGLVSVPLTSRLGRRKSCILFCLLLSASYLCKLSQEYFVLMTGRVLGGFSSSLLFSCFEAWYTHEHAEQHDFPAEWLPHTFTRAAAWNGGIAIAAGITANVCAEWLGLGPASPSVLAVPLLVLSVVLVIREWDENYGQTSSFRRVCGDGLRCLLRDRRVLLLGTIQALFESVVYIFIFLWTPVLDPHNAPLGIAFSSFMAASAVGSSLYHLATSKKYHLQPMHVLCLSILMVFFSLFMLTFSTAPGQEHPTESLLAFLLIELACGLYFPAMRFLRRRLIPEKEQTGVLNWFRVPLNLLAGLGLLVLHDSDYQSGTRNMFSLCAVTMLLALLCVVSLFTMVRNDSELRLPASEPEPNGTE